MQGRNYDIEADLEQPLNEADRSERAFRSQPPETGARTRGRSEREENAMPTMRHAAIAALLMASGGCAEDGPPPASLSPPAAAAVTTVLRASTTVTGQPLAAPPSPWEVLVMTTDLPPGGLLPMHKHPWPRFAFVQSGRLEVRYEQSGLVRTFGPGEAVVEAIDQWHEGRVVGAEPVRLIVLDQLPPGATNVVRR